MRCREENAGLRLENQRLIKQMSERGSLEETHNELDGIKDINQSSVE